MNYRTLSLALMLSIASLNGFAADVPAQLPKPDGKAPTDGKVKVYLLAGQSNMVGFGRYTGGSPVYPSIFLSADPSVVPCRMPVGRSAIVPHGIYQSADKDAAKGARVAVYKGAYKAETDYTKLTPAKQATVALGSTDVMLPSIGGEHTIVANAFIEVPMSGAFMVNVGFEDSTYAVVTLDGEEVYRKELPSTTSTTSTGSGQAGSLRVRAELSSESRTGQAVLTKVNLEKGKRYATTVTYMKGGSAALWLEHVDLKAKGDLATLNKAGKYLWFVDDDGQPTKRSDVIYWDVRTSKTPGGSGGYLHTRSNGKFIGPEVPFGYVMGTFHEEPVLLIESSMGNRALNFDFRPPSSGKTEEEKANEYCGFEYDALVKGVHETLKKLDEVVPGYKGQGYEIAGFVWFQGHKDGGSSKETYEAHLVNLINDLRKEFNAPDMRAAVATVGFGGMKLLPEYEGVHAAQMAVGDPKQHPEYAGKVASVDTRPFWRTRGDSPSGTGYHYNHNAETYILTGDALGRAMVEMLGGKAETLNVPPPPVRHPDVERIFSNEIVDTYTPRSRQKYGKRSENPTSEGYLKMSSALKPIIAGKLIPDFLNDTLGETRSRARGLPLKNIVKGEPIAMRSPDATSQLDSLIKHYEAMGISEYGWKPFGGDLKSAKWNYFSFDPPEKMPFDKSNRFRDITFPKGMENWSAADFDAAQAGWKVGQAPFGQWDGRQEGRKVKPCYQPFCDCHLTPATLWEKEVLLMQQTFDLPAVKPGHAYRVLLGGGNCDRSGEGFAIYVNGKLLTKSAGGLLKYEGTRGAYLTADALSEFKGGKVTISVINYLRYTHFRNKTIYFGSHPEYNGKTVPPNGHVNLWIEEAKLPAAVVAAAAGGGK